jgi:diacylglycerol O-acyltransferase / wax synthase
MRSSRVVGGDSVVATMTDKLTALDATFLELEQVDESAHMHIGGVMVFESPPSGGVPTLEEVRAHLDARLHRLPRYRQRLSQPRTGGLSWPTWEADPAFDMASHVRHATLPAPGDDEELLEWASDFFSHRLDRAHPLWRVVLVDGLADGRWALASKTHHCLVDGVGSVDASYLLLDAEASAPDPPAGPVDPGYTLDVPGPHAPVPAALREVARTGGRIAEAGVHAALHPREALRRSRAVADLLVHEELAGAPPCSLNVPIGGRRSLAIVRERLYDLKAIKRTLGGTVNDVVLTATTGGLRALLLHRGEELPVKGLRAMVPVNIRGGDEHGDLGNRITSLFVDLPVAEEDVLTRYERVVEATAELKSGSQASGAKALIDLTGLAPPVVHATLARSLYSSRLFNVTVTNVPGPQIPLYAFGAEMREVYPLVPLAALHAVGIAILSYDGNVTFCINADRETVPDLDVLRDGIAATIDALSTLVPEEVGDGRTNR